MYRYIARVMVRRTVYTGSDIYSLQCTTYAARYESIIVGINYCVATSTMFYLVRQNPPENDLNVLRAEKSLPDIHAQVSQEQVAIGRLAVQFSVISAGTHGESSRVILTPRGRNIHIAMNIEERCYNGKRLARSTFAKTRSEYPEAEMKGETSKRKVNADLVRRYKNSVWTFGSENKGPECCKGVLDGVNVWVFTLLSFALRWSNLQTLPKILGYSIYFILIY